MTSKIEIQDEERKIQFLERVREIARQNPRLVKLGKLVYYQSGQVLSESEIVMLGKDEVVAVDDGVYISLNINKKGNVTYQADICQEGRARTVRNKNPRGILEAVSEYLPTDFTEFMRRFQFYTDATRKTDLLDPVRVKF